jgi:tetratricopeptide (TPR) repeat protein
MRKNYPEAARFFDKALTLNPEQLEATAGLVGLDIAAGRKELALHRTAARVARAPQNPAVLLFAGRTYAVLGNDPQAETAFKKALEVDAQSLGAYEGLGRLYIRAGRLPEAQREFEELAARQSKPASALTMVGMIQQSRNLATEARATYERVLQHDPRAGVAANNLAWLYLENGMDVNLALQLAQTAKAALPKDAEVSDTLGWVYYRKGMFAPAIRELEQAVALNPGEAVPQYHLGLAYAKNGDKVRAKRALEAALKLNPAFEGAEDASKVLSSL